MGDFCDSVVRDDDDDDEDLACDDVDVDVVGVADAVVLKLGSWNMDPANKPFKPETKSPL